MSPRRGRKHKAWGASPRTIAKNKQVRAREAGDRPSAIARFAGSKFFLDLILGLAPQALCYRPLRGL
jgi:hypothetical protein